MLPNHYHVVLRVDQDKALTLSEEAVIARWERLYTLPLIVEQYQAGTAISRAVEEKAQEIIEKWRQQDHPQMSLHFKKVSRFRQPELGLLIEP